MSRYKRTADPFGQQPYLCVSTEMDETPGNRKSYPGLSGKKAETNPPRQESICTGILRLLHSAEISTMLSTVPKG